MAWFDPSCGKTRRQHKRAIVEQGVLAEQGTSHRGPCKILYAKQIHSADESGSRLSSALKRDRSKCPASNNRLMWHFSSRRRHSGVCGECLHCVSSWIESVDLINAVATLPAGSGARDIGPSFHEQVVRTLHARPSEYAAQPLRSSGHPSPYIRDCTQVRRALHGMQTWRF